MEYKEIIKESYYHDNTGMLLKGDCLEVMKSFPDKSIDMILCDLPYGTTACKWDTIIPFEPLWDQYERIIKDNGAIVLTASQPFTSALVMSNPNLFKYEWIWCKSKASDFINANYRTMKKHENILVFSKGNAAPGCNNKMIYNPQGIILKKSEKIRNGTLGIGRDRISQQGKYVSKGTNYPNSLLQISNEGKTIHPTQKPVELFGYLIKTYTNKNDIVLDNAAGSCTTAIACKNLNRRWICIEQEEKYCDVSVERIKKVMK